MPFVRNHCLNLINETQKLRFPPRSEKRLYLSPRLRYELVTGVVEILRAWAIKWAQLHFCGLNGSEDIPPQSWNIFFYEIGICINIINCPSIQLAILDQSWGKKNIWPLSQILLIYMKGKTRMPWQYKRIANSAFEGTVHTTWQWSGAVKVKLVMPKVTLCTAQCKGNFAVTLKATLPASYGQTNNGILLLTPKINSSTLN